MNDIIVTIQGEILRREKEIERLRELLIMLQQNPQTSGTITTRKTRESRNATVEIAEASIATGRKRAAKGRKKSGRKSKRNATTLDHIKELLQAEQRFLDAKFITDALIAKYPDKKHADLSRYIAVVLSNFKNKGDLVGIKFDEHNVKLNRIHFGLPEWMDQSGNILPDYYFSKA